MIIWRPFMRQMREIGKTRSILGTCIRQWTAGTTIHNEDVFGSFARISLNVKVKGQRLRSPGTKNALYTHNTLAVWTEWNALVADNVAQAAGAAIRSLQRGVFDGMRALGLAGYRWALPRISSYIGISCDFMYILCVCYAVGHAA